jgi:hypothetical protein
MPQDWQRGRDSAFGWWIWSVGVVKMAGVEGQLWGLGIEAAIDPAEWAEKRAGKGKLDAIEARQLDYCAGYSGVGRVRGIVWL